LNPPSEAIQVHSGAGGNCCAAPFGESSLDPPLSSKAMAKFCHHGLFSNPENFKNKS
jgi:hypothetical protein